MECSQSYRSAKKKNNTGRTEQTKEHLWRQKVVHHSFDSRLEGEHHM